jgi:hypothetical protein
MSFGGNSSRHDLENINFDCHTIAEHDNVYDNMTMKRPNNSDISEFNMVCSQLTGLVPIPYSQLQVMLQGGYNPVSTS